MFITDAIKPMWWFTISVVIQEHRQADLKKLLMTIWEIYKRKTFKLYVLFAKGPLRKLWKQNCLSAASLSILNFRFYYTWIYQNRKNVFCCCCYCCLLLLLFYLLLLLIFYFFSHMSSDCSTLLLHPINPENMFLSIILSGKGCLMLSCEINAYQRPDALAIGNSLIIELGRYP